MSVVGLLSLEEHDGRCGQFLTFIAPAPNGCNLRCAFCVVRQRREASQAFLQPDDLARFIREAHSKAPIFAVGVQGYEPLLPEALPYTQAALSAARLLGLPATLVTNGILLGQEAERLKVLKPAKIGVSLDAASPEDHDRVRGVKGAWASTVKSIRRALDVLSPHTKLAVVSVLVPTKRSRLEQMPALLRDMGVTRWIINPLLRIGRDRDGGPVADPQSLFRDLLILQDAANDAGVQLTVDDEFDCLRHDRLRATMPELRGVHIRALPHGVELYRLAADGRCSAGRQILRRISEDALRWRPGVENAGDFLSRARRLSDYGRHELQPSLSLRRRVMAGFVLNQPSMLPCP
jgi:MoaA/NifB/PqqE/SkfB family radical SAM enzyme